MRPILIFLALVSVAIGTIALYYFLIKSFFTRGVEKANQTERSRILREKMKLFISAVIVSEVLGLFFLLLADSVQSLILTFNGFAFLLASSFCSFLTIFNAVQLEEVDFQVRETLQFGTLILSLLLIRISTESFFETIAMFISYFSIVYFSTSVIAVIVILWDAMKIEVKYLTRYLIAVIVIGILVGSGLMVVANHWPIIK